MRKLGRKRKVKRLQLVGKLDDNMMGKPILQKYLDLSSPVVKIHINGVEIPNTLIDLGPTINTMSK